MKNGIYDYKSNCEFDDLNGDFFSRPISIVNAAIKFYLDSLVIQTIRQEIYNLKRATLSLSVINLALSSSSCEPNSPRKFLGWCGGLNGPLVHLLTINLRGNFGNLRETQTGTAPSTRVVPVCHLSH